MPKFQYVGKEKHNLAGVGIISAAAVFLVTEKQAEALEKNAPELYKRVAETVPLTPSKVRLTDAPPQPEEAK